MLRMRALSLVVVGLAALGACGDDDDDSAADTATPTPAADESGGDGSELTVVAQDIEFPQETYEVPAGTVEVVYENEGSIVHTLLIEDVDGFKLTVPGNGDVDEGTVELEPGGYTLFCDVPGHRSAGMEAELQVT